MASPATARNPFARSSAYHLFMVVLAVICALAIGISVGQGRWLIVAALAVLPLVLRWPVQIALSAFVLLVCFESGTSADSGIGQTLGWFVGASTAGILVATGVAGRRLRTPPPAALWWILAVGWAALTGFWALVPQIVVQRLPTAFALLVLYLAVASLRVEEREFKPVVGVLIVGGFLAAAYACYEFYQGIGYHSPGLRASLVIGGVVVNPDLFAARLTLPLALAVSAFFAATSGLRRTIMLGVSGFLILVILLTQSRAALLALLVMTGIFLIRLGVNRRILAVAAAIPVLLMFLPEQFFRRLHMAGQTGGAGRWDIWHVGLEGVKHFGLFGAGLSNFPKVYEMYAGSAPVFQGFDLGAHNLYLQITVECGIVGLFLLLMALRVQLLAGRKDSGNTAKPNIWLVGCEAAGWSLAVACVFADLMWEKIFWLTWIMVALGTQLYAKSVVQRPHRERQTVP